VAPCQDPPEWGSLRGKPTSGDVLWVFTSALQYKDFEREESLRSIADFDPDVETQIGIVLQRSRRRGSGPAPPRGAVAESGPEAGRPACLGRLAAWLRCTCLAYRTYSLYADARSAWLPGRKAAWLRCTRSSYHTCDFVGPCLLWRACCRFEACRVSLGADPDPAKPHGPRDPREVPPLSQGPPAQPKDKHRRDLWPR